MKSFAAVIVAASAAVTSAQVISNGDGSYTCPIPNGAYCAGDSLGTNIIIRCTNGVGQPGNCNDNLAGEFPRGVNFAPCWQPSAASGQAACSKNCIVYGGSGAYNGTFTLPGCVPSTTQSTAQPTTTSTYINPGTSVAPTTTITYTNPVPTSSPNVSYTTYINPGVTTVTVPCISGTPIYTPPGVTFPTAVNPTGSAPAPHGNETVPTTSAPGGGSGPGGAGSATATPVGPTTSAPVVFTGAAATNQAGLLAAAGLAVAYFL